ncbi:MAG: DUF4406 domain-containing protein [Oscillospiraceae bacterium]
MKVNLYNSEGYLDPTAHDAIVNVLKEQRKRPYMPKVFISSPFAGDLQRNIKNARRYCAFAVRSGYIPFAPHLFYPQFLSDGNTEQRELGLFMGMVFLDGCKEVWVFGERISSGMQREIDRAEKRGIPIRFFNDQCEEVSPK